MNTTWYEFVQRNFFQNCGRFTEVSKQTSSEHQTISSSGGRLMVSRWTYLQSYGKLVNGIKSKAYMAAFKTLTIWLKLCLSSFSDAMTLNVCNQWSSTRSESVGSQVQDQKFSKIILSPKKHRTSAKIDYRALTNDYLRKILPKIVAKGNNLATK